MTRKYIRDPNAMWTAIRKLKKFTRRELLRAMKIDRDDNTISPFLKKLMAGGYLRKVSEAKSGHENIPAVYELIKDAGINYPRLSKEGKKRPPSERQRMWVAMKVIGTSPFDWRDLSLVAKTKPTVTKEYCTYLLRGGYLKIARKSVPGTPAKYLFIRSMDSGLLAPEVRARRTELFDVNKQKLVWTKGGAE